VVFMSGLAWWMGSKQQVKSDRVDH
jgi:hypothetical protein